ncbi:MAG TPA: MFS transporter [Gammaproteobacteria bacterium]|nr:MFS transporter [Gammaproteobacteria bacterium]
MTSLRDHRVLIASCGAHLIQDGLVALQYVLLPLLAQVFGLNYTQVGLLRAVSNSAMTLLEIPAGVLAERCGETRLLILGLMCAASGYLGVAFAVDFYLIAIGFLVAGSGAAFQHSLASALISKSFDDAGRRRSLGLYNAFGDLGKLAFTGSFSLAIGVGIAWNLIVTALCLVTLGFAVLLVLLTRRQSPPPANPADSNDAAGADSKWGIKHPRRFGGLCFTVFLDTLAQSVFLTFIAFLLLEKGAGDALASFAVVLALAGGMVGKFASGYLAVRCGDRGAFRILQVMTISGLLILVSLPVVPILILLPLIGVAIQGSTTVTYGALADFIHRDRQSRGYAIIYTLSSLSAVVGPVVFGGLADLYGVEVSLLMLAVLTSLTLFSGKVLMKSVPLANI